jgi:hypothetical protein
VRRPSASSTGCTPRRTSPTLAAPTPASSDCWTRTPSGTCRGDNAIAGTYQGVEAVLGFAQIGAIVTVFVWCLAVEQILAGVSTSAARLLPLLGAMTMAGADSRAAMPPLPNGIHPSPSAR